MTDYTPSLTVEAPSTDTDRAHAEPPPEREATPLVEADLLVEEVSIDGMCGVY
jgi:mycofactocin precursor